MYSYFQEFKISITYVITYAMTNLFERTHNTLSDKMYNGSMVLDLKIWALRTVSLNWLIFIIYFYQIISNFKIRKHFLSSLAKRSLLILDFLTWESSEKIDLLAGNCSVLHKTLLAAKFSSAKCLVSMTVVKLFNSFCLYFWFCKCL